MIRQVGLVGLGKMGHGIALRLRQAGIRVIGTDLSEESLAKAREIGVEAVASIAELVAALPERSVVWLMLPPGRITADAIAEVAAVLDKGHVVVDGGNSNFADSAANAATIREAGGEFVDVGVSGGQWGWKEGYGLMVGASLEAYGELGVVLDALSGTSAHSRVGGTGSGHLVKALHNGVQYAVMQAYAEGFALLEAHEEVDTVAAVSAWQNGSSIRSYLLEQMLEVLVRNPTLDGVEPVVPDSGMGRWTAQEALRLGVPTPVLTTALYARFHSRAPEDAEKLLRASRSQIGGQR